MRMRARDVAKSVFTAFISIIGFIPTIHAATPFTTNSNFSVGSDGSANYSIPIQVPPGTAGMAPTLSLNYNSNGGNGTLGMGWSLDGLSQISRCPTTIIQDGVVGGVNYDSNDKMCIDGQRLFRVNASQPYGGDGTEYRTELANFAKIISYGVAGNGPAYFKVWTKAGQIIEYGNSADSRIEAAGIATARTWGVNKISDTKGNYITVSYVEDNPNGEAYVSRVDYTGNATTGLAPYANVQFTYEARPDPGTGYHAGSILKQTKRITNIKTYTNSSTLVKDYRLTYEQGTATQRSRLKTLTECDGAGASCLRPVVMTWGDKSVGFQFQRWETKAGGFWDAQRWFVVDANGDGKADLVNIFSDQNLMSVDVHVNTGSSFQIQRWETKAGGYWEAQNWDAADVNGDGKVDLVNIFSDSGLMSVDVHLNTGNSFQGQRWETRAGGFWSGQKWSLADVNGDGRADLVNIFSDSGLMSVDVHISTGSSFQGQRWETKAGGFWDTQRWFVVDANGDGKADLVNIFNDPTVSGLMSSDVHLSSLGLPDFLTTLTSGLGSATTLSYKPITDSSIYVKGTIGEAGSSTCPQPIGNDGVANSYPVVNLQEPQYVVSTATISDGNNGVLTNNYNYGGLKAHMTGRGSLGFRYQKVTQLDADINTTTFFRQNFPFIGLPCQTEKRITSTGAVIGLSQLNYTNNAFATNAGATINVPNLVKSIEQSFEINGGLVSTTTTNNSYDSFGNVTQIKVDSGDGYIKITDNVYKNDPASYSASAGSGNWFIGRLLRSTVKSVNPYVVPVVTIPPPSPPTPPPAPTTWTFCANEGEACSFSGTKTVRYGAEGSYVTADYTNGLFCNNATFGSDPLYGVAKTCEVLQ